MMILKEIAHKVAQAFRLAQAADKKLSTGIAAALDAKAEQLREYEKSFEPEPPKPEPLSHLTNNWRKMHGLPMHRKPASFRRRRKNSGTGKQSK